MAAQSRPPGPNLPCLSSPTSPHWCFSRKLKPILRNFPTPPEDQDNIIARTRRFILLFVPLILPLLAYALPPGWAKTSPGLIFRFR